MYSTKDLRNDNLALLRRLHRQRESNALKEFEKQKQKQKRERELFEMKRNDNGNGLNPFKEFLPLEFQPRNMNRRESRSDYNRQFSRLGLFINRRGR